AKFDDTYTILTELHNLIPTVDVAVHPILYTMEASGLVDSLQFRRTSIASRTAVIGDNTDDIATWDTNRFLEEIDKRLTSARESAVAIGNPPIDAYNEILVDPQRTAIWLPT